ncbi:MAG TPA: hypothetical protein VGR11_02270 [Solirubrobacteraceae bacterium]|nr:hypothetical protein [Solirubrobacteraceae bacterium]
MTEGTRLQPPSGGMAPPTTTMLPDGTEVDLLAPARKIADEHLARHPEELERYGEAVRAWCIHDNQHLLNWAALDLAGAIDFDAQLHWLANVLAARGYPLESLADDLDTAASVLRRSPSSDARRALADRLAAAAANVGLRG